MCRAVQAAVIAATALWALACSSSLSVADDFDIHQFLDGGMEVLDVSDNRDIPRECHSYGECDDGDPCTIGICFYGRCRYEMKTVTLHPVPVDTKESAIDVSLSEGRMYVLEQRGTGGVLEVFDIGVITEPSIVASSVSQGTPVDLAANERGVVVAAGIDGIETFTTDLSRLTDVAPGRGCIRNLEEVWAVGMGPVNSIAAGYANGVSIVDFADLADPAYVAQVDTTGRAIGAVSVGRSFALIADSLNGAVVVDFAAEGGPDLGGKVPTDGRVVDVAVDGDTALMAEYGAGFGVADLSDTDAPKRLALVPAPSPVVAVGLLGPQTGVVAWKNGVVAVFDLIDPLRPRVITTWESAFEPEELDVRDSLIAVAIGSGGVTLLQTGCSSPLTDDVSP
ncbi:MAG: hypothetical protein GY762_09005 [Proteobacteria bacterium]|nr:hypothetical protein [Pseudomonadota bacterium]